MSSSNLKTLIDIEKKYNCSTKYPCMYNNQEALSVCFNIKQEAIKWIKYMESIKDKSLGEVAEMEYYGNQLDDFFIGEHDNFEQVIEWIKWFFNLRGEKI